MSIRNNYPTVNPTLDLDFANTRRLDPRVTFTRSSTATYYDGSKALAEQNLLLNSQTFNTTWVASSITFATGITDPLGTTIAYTATASGANATVYQSVIIPADTFTFSIYIQRITGTGTINLTLDGTTMTVASVTGSWVRYTATQALTAGTYTVGIKIVTSGDAVNIWGAQLEQRSSASAYNVTTTSIVANYISVLKTAAINQPRFDVDPVTGESKGLLIEEARTNICLYSGDYTQWTLSEASTSGVFTTPTGSQSAIFLASTNALAHRINKTGLAVSTSPANVTYCYGAFIYKPEGSDVGRLNFRLRSASGNGQNIALDVTGSTTTTTFNFVASVPFGTTPPAAVTSSAITIQNYGNGVFRVSIASPASASTDNISQIDIGFGTNADTSAGTINTKIGVWGLSVEAGSFPTSYIPTTSGQVTRTADNASMTGTAFSSWYNQSEGTIVATFDMYNATVISGAFPRVISISNGTNANLIDLQSRQYANEDFSVTDAAAPQCTITLAQFAANTFGKLAGTYQVNNFQAAANGVLGTADLTGTVPAVNQLQLGNRWDMARPMSGHIKSIRYYPARVTNAQLQALTSI